MAFSGYYRGLSAGCGSEPCTLEASGERLHPIALTLDFTQFQAVKPEFTHLLMHLSPLNSIKFH